MIKLRGTRTGERFTVPILVPMLDVVSCLVLLFA